MNLEIPKNVRQALEKQAVSGPHPDADLLNAYAERALSTPEDAQIAGHLANCGDCREVVFLANSAVEIPAVPARAAESEPGAVTWWRWAMPATALLAIAIAFVAMDHNVFRKDQAPQEAKAMPNSATPLTPSAAPKESAPTAAAPAPPPAVIRQPAATTRDRKTSRSDANSADAFSDRNISAASAITDRTATDKKAAALNAPRPTIGQAPQKASIVAGALGGTSVAVTAAAPPIPKGLPDYQGVSQQNSNVAFGGQSGRANVLGNSGPRSQALSSKDADVIGPVPPPPVPLEETSAKFEAVPSAKIAGRAKPALQLSFTGSEPRRNAISRMAIQFWRITSDGHVEHFMQNQWNRTLAGVQKSFRVVAYLQNHVWAGGSGPELFHSADNGESWNTVKVKSADAELSGTMQSIRATDEKHVAVIADDGSVWVTIDGGQTWEKQ